MSQVSSRFFPRQVVSFSHLFQPLFTALLLRSSSHGRDHAYARRCYLTLTQALHLRMGGNPFGPAGTGKTESVKALGAQLGRFVLVFNCDESFDYSAMGRLFAGLCQVECGGVCFVEVLELVHGGL